VAWLALRAAERREAGGAQEILGEFAQQAGLDARDRRLAFEMMQGVLRAARLLDAALERLEGFEHAAAAPGLQDLLRLGAYQHFSLSRIPAHAVVHATVEVARARLGERAAGFCNAALHGLVRRFPKRGADLENFARDLPVEVRHSLPGWIVRLARRTVGPENLEAALAALNRPLPLYARANAAVAAPRGVVAALSKVGIVARARPDLAPHCVEIDEAAGPVVETEIFRRGGFILQDASSQMVAEFVGARPGMTVIDFCAAPGGKTAALASAMQGKGCLVACDVSESRMERLGENIRRLGLAEFVQIRLVSDSSEEVDALHGEIGERAGADRVLVDAPCSGLGTLRRHPEIRLRLRNADLKRLAQLQGEILDRASRLVRPGGRLVYATCSFAAEENDEVVEAFVERHAGRFEVVRDGCDLPPFLSERVGPDGWLRTLPHRDETDCAVAVRLVRDA
jgi:16S rRNA (cytosine967-C5)-methyltransferase